MDPFWAKKKSVLVCIEAIFIILKNSNNSINSRKSPFGLSKANVKGFKDLFKALLGTYLILAQLFIAFTSKICLFTGLHLDINVVHIGPYMSLYRTKYSILSILSTLCRMTLDLYGQFKKNYPFYPVFYPITIQKSTKYEIYQNFIPKGPT